MANYILGGEIMKNKNFRFIVKENSGGQPYIRTEPLEQNEDYFDLFIELPEETDINKAYEIANYLEKNVKGIHLEDW